MKKELWIIYEGNEFIPFVGDNSHGFWESSPVMYQSVEWDAGCFLFVLFLCGSDGARTTNKIYIHLGNL